MSISYLAMALRTQLPRAQKLVLLCLAESCNDWGFCTPGHKYLSFKCCISVRTVIRTLQELTDTGYIIAKKTPGKPTLYQLKGNEHDIPAIAPDSQVATPEITISVSTPEIERPKPNLSSKSKDLSSSAKMSPVSECHQCQNVTSDKMSLPGSPSLPPSSPPNGFPSDSLSFTPLLSPHSPPEKIQPQATSGKQFTKYSEDFTRFWKIYPRGDGKGQAYKAWKKLNPSDELQKEIIAHVEKRKTLDRQWLEKDGQFIHWASTFLNNQMWEDDYSKVKIDPRDKEPNYRNHSEGLQPWEL